MSDSSDEDASLGNVPLPPSPPPDDSPPPESGQNIEIDVLSPGKIPIPSDLPPGDSSPFLDEIPIPQGGRHGGDSDSEEQPKEDMDMEIPLPPDSSKYSPSQATGDDEMMSSPTDSFEPVTSSGAVESGSSSGDRKPITKVLDRAQAKKRLMAFSAAKMQAVTSSAAARSKGSPLKGVTVFKPSKDRQQPSDSSRLAIESIKQEETKMREMIAVNKLLAEKLKQVNSITNSLPKPTPVTAIVNPTVISGTERLAMGADIKVNPIPPLLSTDPNSVVGDGASSSGLTLMKPPSSSSRHLRRRSASSSPSPARSHSPGRKGRGERDSRNRDSRKGGRRSKSRSRSKSPSSSSSRKPRRSRSRSKSPKSRKSSKSSRRSSSKSPKRTSRSGRKSRSGSPRRSSKSRKSRSPPMEATKSKKSSRRSKSKSPIRNKSPLQIKGPTSSVSGRSKISTSKSPPPQLMMQPVKLSRSGKSRSRSSSVASGGIGPVESSSSKKSSKSKKQVSRSRSRSPKRSKEEKDKEKKRSRRSRSKEKESSKKSKRRDESRERRKNKEREEKDRERKEVERREAAERDLIKELDKVRKVRMPLDWTEYFQYKYNPDHIRALWIPMVEGAKARVRSRSGSSSRSPSPSKDLSAAQPTPLSKGLEKPVKNFGTIPIDLKSGERGEYPTFLVHKTSVTPPVAYGMNPLTFGGYYRTRKQILKVEDPEISHAMSQFLRASSDSLQQQTVLPAKEKKEQEWFAQTELAFCPTEGAKGVLISHLYSDEDVEDSPRLVQQGQAKPVVVGKSAVAAITPVSRSSLDEESKSVGDASEEPEHDSLDSAPSPLLKKRYDEEIRKASDANERMASSSSIKKDSKRRDHRSSSESDSERLRKLDRKHKTPIVEPPVASLKPSTKDSKVSLEKVTKRLPKEPESEDEDYLDMDVDEFPLEKDSLCPALPPAAALAPVQLREFPPVLERERGTGKEKHGSSSSKDKKAKKQKKAKRHHKKRGKDSSSSVRGSDTEPEVVVKKHGKDKDLAVSSAAVGGKVKDSKEKHKKRRSKHGKTHDSDHSSFGGGSSNPEPSDEELRKPVKKKSKNEHEPSPKVALLPKEPLPPAVFAVEASRKESSKVKVEKSVSGVAAGASVAVVDKKELKKDKKSHRKSSEDKGKSSSKSKKHSKHSKKRPPTSSDSESSVNEHKSSSSDSSSESSNAEGGSDSEDDASPRIKSKKSNSSSGKSSSKKSTKKEKESKESKSKKDRKRTKSSSSEDEAEEEEDDPVKDKKSKRGGDKDDKDKDRKRDRDRDRDRDGDKSSRGGGGDKSGDRDSRGDRGDSRSHGRGDRDRGDTDRDRERDRDRDRRRSSGSGKKDDGRRRSNFNDLFDNMGERFGDKLNFEERALTGMNPERDSNLEKIPSTLSTASVSLPTLARVIVSPPQLNLNVLSKLKLDIGMEMKDKPTTPIRVRGDTHDILSQIDDDLFLQSVLNNEHFSTESLLRNLSGPAASVSKPLSHNVQRSAFTSNWSDDSEDDTARTPVSTTNEVPFKTEVLVSAGETTPAAVSSVQSTSGYGTETAPSMSVSMSPISSIKSDSSSSDSSSDSSDDDDSSSDSSSSSDDDESTTSGSSSSDGSKGKAAVSDVKSTAEGTALVYDPFEAVISEIAAVENTSADQLKREVFERIRNEEEEEELRKLSNIALATELIENFKKESFHTGIEGSSLVTGISSIDVISTNEGNSARVLEMKSERRSEKGNRRISPRFEDREGPHRDRRGYGRGERIRDRRDRDFHDLRDWDREAHDLRDRDIHDLRERDPHDLRDRELHDLRDRERYRSRRRPSPGHSRSRSRSRSHSRSRSLSPRGRGDKYRHGGVGVRQHEYGDRDRRRFIRDRERDPKRHFRGGERDFSERDDFYSPDYDHNRRRRFRDDYPPHPDHHNRPGDKYHGEAYRKDLELESLDKHESPPLQLNVADSTISDAELAANNQHGLLQQHQSLPPPPGYPMESYGNHGHPHHPPAHAPFLCSMPFPPVMIPPPNMQIPPPQMLQQPPPQLQDLPTGGEEPCPYDYGSPPRRLSLDERLEMEMGIKVREVPKKIYPIDPYHGAQGYYPQRNHAYPTAANVGQNWSIGTKGMGMHAQQFNPMSVHHQQRQQCQIMQLGNVIQVVPTEIPNGSFTISASVEVTQNSSNKNQATGTPTGRRVVTIKVPVVPFQMPMVAPLPQEQQLTPADAAALLKQRRREKAKRRERREKEKALAKKIRLADEEKTKEKENLEETVEEKEDMTVTAEELALLKEALTEVPVELSADPVVQDDPITDEGSVDEIQDKATTIAIGDREEKTSDGLSEVALGEVEKLGIVEDRSEPDTLSSSDEVKDQEDKVSPDGNVDCELPVEPVVVEEGAEAKDVPKSPPKHKVILPLPLAGKGILVAVGFREKSFDTSRSQESKGVKFADGINPGYGTESSEGEEMRSPPPPSEVIEEPPPPPVKKRSKKKRRSSKGSRSHSRKSSLKAAMDDTILPPPAPADVYPFCHPGILYQVCPQYAVLYAQVLAEKGFDIIFQETRQVPDNAETTELPVTAPSIHEPPELSYPSEMQDRDIPDFQSIETPLDPHEVKCGPHTPPDNNTSPSPKDESMDTEISKEDAPAAVTPTLAVPIFEGSRIPTLITTTRTPLPPVGLRVNFCDGSQSTDIEGNVSISVEFKSSTPTIPWRSKRYQEPGVSSQIYNHHTPSPITMPSPVKNTNIVEIITQPEVSPLKPADDKFPPLNTQDQFSPMKSVDLFT